MKHYQMNHTKHLTEPELKHLIRLLTGVEKTKLRDYLAIMLLLKTGARESELIQITKSDLNPADKEIFINGTKGSLSRSIPLKPKLFNLVMKYADSIDTDRLFPITTRALQAIWHYYRPVKKGMHSLRHTCAIEIYKRHKDIKLVKDMLGHVNIKNTMIYADYIRSPEEKRKMAW